MAKVELVKDQVTLNLKEGQSILDASLEAGVGHMHACGGEGFCSTCRVYVEEDLENIPERNEKEAKLAQKLGLIPEVRLACQTIPNGDIKARRPIWHRKVCC